jgi:hypothetical protein
VPSTDEIKVAEQICDNTAAKSRLAETFRRGRGPGMNRFENNQFRQTATAAAAC